VNSDVLTRAPLLLWLLLGTDSILAQVSGILGKVFGFQQNCPVLGKVFDFQQNGPAF
jgi:hypothetical protein